MFLLEWKEYNLFLNNHFSLTFKVVLALVGGIAACIIPGILNIKSIKKLLKSSPLPSKYLKLIFLNLPVFIVQAFILFVVVVIIGGN